MAYVAVNLEASAVERLRGLSIPEGWSCKCHHMTLHLGPHNSGDPPLGSPVNLTVDAIGTNGLALAVRVSKSTVKSSNTVPHVTLAVNASRGGKPVDSNKIKKWQEIKSFELKGTVEQND